MSTRIDAEPDGPPLAQFQTEAPSVSRPTTLGATIKLGGGTKFVAQPINEATAPSLNPFANPEDEDSIHIQDVSKFDIKELQHGQDEVVKPLSQSHTCIQRSLTDRKAPSHSDVVPDGSDWETLPPDHEPEGAHRRVSRYKARQMNRRNTVVFLPNKAHISTVGETSPSRLSRQHSIYSASSFYSDFDQEDWVDDDHAEWTNFNDYVWAGLRKRPATLGLDRNFRGELATSLSKTSSSASLDRFKYDGDLYSPFLQLSAERDVSKALHRTETAYDLKIDLPQTVDKCNPPQEAGPNRFRCDSFYNASALRSA